MPGSGTGITQICPPFRGDAFWTIGAHHAPWNPAPDEAERWSVGNLCDHIHRLWTIEQHEGTGAHCLARGGSVPGPVGQTPLKGCDAAGGLGQVARLGRQNRDACIAKPGYEPVSQGSKIGGIYRLAGKGCREGPDPRFHGGSSVRFQQKKVDPVAGVECIQGFREKAENVLRCPDRPGGRDRHRCQRAIGPEGVQGEAPRAAAMGGKVGANLFGEIGKAGMNAVTFDQGFRTGQAGSIVRRWPQRDKRRRAKAEGLVENGHDLAGDLPGLEAAAKGLAVYAIELADAGETKPAEECERVGRQP